MAFSFGETRQCTQHQRAIRTTRLQFTTKRIDLFFNFDFIWYYQERNVHVKDETPMAVSVPRGMLFPGFFKLPLRLLPAKIPVTHGKKIANNFRKSISSGLTLPRRSSSSNPLSKLDLRSPGNPTTREWGSKRFEANNPMRTAAIAVIAQMRKSKAIRLTCFIPNNETIVSKRRSDVPYIREQFSIDATKAIYVIINKLKGGTSIIVQVQWN